MRISNRIGAVTITYEMLEDNRDLISNCFHSIQFIPLMIEVDPLNLSYRYTGVSPEFQEIPEGGKHLEYEFTVKDVDGVQDLGIKIRGWG